MKKTMGFGWYHMVPYFQTEPHGEDDKLGELDTSCEVNLGISRLSMVS